MTRLHLQSIATENKIDTAFVFTGISQYAPLPVPYEFSAQFENKAAILKWNIFIHNNIYVAWEIERSENGKTFSPVTTEPYVHLYSPENQNPEYTFKYDTLPANGKEYHYRIRGISSFGEKGSWSAIVKGKGIETIENTPNIKQHNITKGKVTVEWEFPKEYEHTINGFKILRADNHNGKFTELNTKLKPSERKYTDTKPLQTGYYKIAAYKQPGMEKQSFPYLVQLTDSIPPGKPVGLSGTVDTLGVVTLTWKANPEKDIYGYRVFRSVSGKDEFSQRTHRPVSTTTFTDTISTKDLNASIFYKIMAVDQRQNQSEFSNIVEIIKPDNTPPSIPVITAIEPSEGKIKLTWINSTSPDVARHEVFRKKTSDSIWTKIHEIPVPKKVNTEFEYIDTTPEATDSQYKIKAVDKSGNISESFPSIDIKSLKSNQNESVKKIRQQIDRETGRLRLTWQLPGKEIKYIKIYRKTGNQPYSVYATLEGNLSAFEDYKLKTGETYVYAVKLIFVDATVSGFSEEVKVNF